MPLSSDHALLVSDPNVREILEAAGVWLWDADLEHDVTTFQEGFWEQFGYDGSGFAETFDFLKVVHTRDQKALARAWRSHLDGETELYESEWRLRTADGNWRWVASRGKVVSRDSEGRALRLVGAYRDITDQKHAQIRLEGSSAELNAVFRGSTDGIMLISSDLRILRANEAAIAIVQKVTGFDLSTTPDIVALPALAPDRPVLAGINMALAGRDSAQEVSVRLEGVTHWFEVSYTIVHYDDGAVLGVAVTMRDVTNRKRLEEARKRTERIESLGLMAGGIAHDFNNLLTAIIANIDVAASGPVEAEAKESLDEARDAARRASELVQRLLTFVGRGPEAQEPVDISEISAEMVRYARKLPAAERVRFETDFAEGLPRVLADATQLRQVVLNLLANAVDAVAAAETPRITVRTWAPEVLDGLLPQAVLVPAEAEGYVALCVADNGTGMDDETRERIFDPLFTTKESGHGLGLASVLGAVRNHGAGLSVESEPGAGARFTVAFPVTSPA